MNDVIKIMLDRYACKSLEEQERALKEIIQEIALLGLWRSKFYEHAAFYGGTALRIFYGLDRFSEDLDFSLLKAKPNFTLESYKNAIETELRGFGFDVTFERKEKKGDSKVDSAFIKANTMIHLIKINAPWTTHKDKLIKIKLEVDNDPPGSFDTEDQQIFLPVPFSVKLFSRHDLFAGKLHAALCRKRVRNVKGRDWYDFLWNIGRNIPVNTKHLELRMRQSGDWTGEKSLTLEILKTKMREKISSADLSAWKQDVRPFVTPQATIDGWSKELFLAAVDRLNSV